MNLRELEKNIKEYLLDLYLVIPSRHHEPPSLVVVRTTTCGPLCEGWGSIYVNGA